MSHNEKKDCVSAMLGAFEAFETLSEINSVRFAAIVRGEPIEITATPKEMVEFMRAARDADKMRTVIAAVHKKYCDGIDCEMCAFEASEDVG